MNYKTFLNKRKNRAISTVLSFKEKHCDQYIPPDVSSKLREVILDELNELYETAIDLLDDNINEDFLDMLDMLDDIHEAIVKEKS